MYINIINLEFLNQTWNICAVSLLYNFEFNNEVKLKLYAKRLREEVACMVSKENVTYDAKISVLEMKRPTETDEPTIKVNKFFISKYWYAFNLFLKF